MVLVTDKERFSGIGIFYRPSFLNGVASVIFTLNYSFITEALDEGKVKHISFVEEHLQSYLGYYLNKLCPRESH